MPEVSVQAGDEPTVSYVPIQAVAGDAARIRATGRELGKLAGFIHARTSDMDAELRGSVAVWTGGSGDAYRDRMKKQGGSFTTLERTIVPVVARACDDLAAGLETAKSQMDTAISAALAVGVTPPPGVPGRPDPEGWYVLGRVCLGGRPAPGSGLLSTYTDVVGYEGKAYWVAYGNPLFVKDFLQRRRLAEEHLRPVVQQASLAFRTARRARLDFVRAVGGVREELGRLLYGPPTAAERVVDQLVGTGEVGNWNTTAAPVMGKPDPEGRIINFRYGDPYQAGGVFYTDDERFAPYLMRNNSLAADVMATLRTAIANHHDWRQPLSIDIRKNVELIDNGYGTGYQLLHGTEATVGDFHIKGVIRKVGDVYQVDATYTWNDVIDPNPNVRGDQYGVLTPGTPYDMHISWRRQATLAHGPTGLLYAREGSGNWPNP